MLQQGAVQQGRRRRFAVGASDRDDATWVGGQQQFALLRARNAAGESFLSQRIVIGNGWTRNYQVDAIEQREVFTAELPVEVAGGS